MKINFSLLLFASLMLASCSSTKQEKYATTTPVPAYKESRSVASADPETEVGEEVEGEEADAAKATIERWSGSKELSYVVRDGEGRFLRIGTLKQEGWTREGQTKWVPRTQDGRFRGGIGRVEKFRSDKGNEHKRIVVRDENGRFVTSEAIDDLVSAKIEKRNGDSYYVERLKNGKFLNSAKGELESWSNYPFEVLVFRDTSDAGNNGKILTWVAPDASGRYHDPKNGQFISGNRD